MSASYLLGDASVKIDGREFVTVHKGCSVGPTGSQLEALSAFVGQRTPSNTRRVVPKNMTRGEYRALARRVDKLRAKYRAGKITAMQLAEALHAMGLMSVPPWHDPSASVDAAVGPQPWVERTCGEAMR